MTTPAAVHQATTTLNLQSTLSASSVTAASTPLPHHPIACPGPLQLHDDGRFACDHTEVPAGDTRTQHCLNHTAAILLLELAHAR